MLTTAQLTKEVGNLKELLTNRQDHSVLLMDAKLASFTSQREALIRMVEARFDAMDKAVVLVQSQIDRLPGLMNEKIQGLRRLDEERFSLFQVQLRERDVRREQAARDAKSAVELALRSAKEAVVEQNKSSAMAIQKSEAATAKQLDALAAAIQSGAKAAEDKVQDLKDRLVRLEGNNEGRGVAAQTHNMSSSLLVSIISLILAFVSVVTALVVMARH